MFQGIAFLCTYIGVLWLITYVSIKLDDYIKRRARRIKYEQSIKPKVIVDNEWVKWTTK